MKGLSVLMTLALLVLAHQLARHLRKTGGLPVDNRPVAAVADSNTLTASTQAHYLGVRQDL